MFDTDIKCPTCSEVNSAEDLTDVTCYFCGYPLSMNYDAQDVPINRTRDGQRLRRRRVCGQYVDEYFR